MRTANDYANDVCDYLKREGYYPAGSYPSSMGPSTPFIARAINVPDTSRDTLLKCLDKLALCGVLRKSGNSKFMWSLRVNEWSHVNPYGRHEAPDVDEDEDEEEVAAPEPDTSIGSPGSIVIHQLRNRVGQLDTEVTNLKSKVSGLETALESQQQVIEVMDKKLKEGSGFFKEITIKRYDSKVTKLKNVILPECFERVLALARQRRNVLLVGPAGCGKSTIAKLLADTMGMDFYKIGGSGGLSEVHLTGSRRPNLSGGRDGFNSTEFLEGFEHGGVTLIDELDGADPNVMLILNPALDAGGLLPVPNRTANPKAKKHTDFICVATANTYGRGADRKYVGRNQLDESTLSRFRVGIIDVDYDRGVETAVCPDDELRTKCWEIRQKIFENGLRRVMCTRFMADAYHMKKTEGWDTEKCLEGFFNGWGAEEKVRVYS